MPLAAIVTSGNASLRWLTRQPPEIDEAGLAVGGIIEDANRASEIIGRVHSLVTKNPVRKDLLDINEAILEVTALTPSEAIKHGVAVRTQLAHRLPRINGDKVQLQQVMLNLILNAIQAMMMTFKEAAEAYNALHEQKWRNAKHRKQFLASLACYAYPVFAA